MFTVFWNFIKPFLDEATRSKFHILGPRSDWEPVLKKYISDDQLPIKYGGTLVPLTDEEIVAEWRKPSPLLPGLSSSLPLTVPPAAAAAAAGAGAGAILVESPSEAEFEVLQQENESAAIDEAMKTVASQADGVAPMVN